MLPYYQEDGYDPDETKLLVIEYPGRRRRSEAGRDSMTSPGPVA